jgi:hypothetical protein
VRLRQPSGRWGPELNCGENEGLCLASPGASHIDRVRGLLFRDYSLSLFQNHTACEVSAVSLRKKEQLIFKGKLYARDQDSARR